MATSSPRCAPTATVRIGSSARRALDLGRGAMRMFSQGQALAQLPRLAFAAELGAALANPNLDADVRASVVENLSERFASLPSVEAVRRYLAKKFQEQLANYQEARSGRTNLTNLVWRLGPGRPR